MGKADVQQVEPQWAIAAKVLKICVVAQLVIAICIIELENNSFNGGGNLAILCILQTDGKMDMAKTPKNSLDIWGICQCGNIPVMVFGITLLWYKDKVCPEYTCVVGGILSNRQIADKEILDVLNQLVW